MIVQRQKELQQQHLTMEERQVRLLDASKEYMSGNINHSQFQEIERKYRTDYRFVTFGLATQYQPISRFLRFLFA